MTFSMWSLGHYVFLISPFIGIALLYYFTKSNDQEKIKRLVSYYLLLQSSYYYLGI